MPKKLEAGPTLKKSSSSKWLLAAFIIIFAAGGYIIYRSFAAPRYLGPPVHQNSAPTVSIDTPKNNDVVHGTVSITATASDNGSVAGVQFMLNGAKLGDEDTTAPYSTDWDTTKNSKLKTAKLTAVARDDTAKTTTSSAVQVKIDNQAPTVKITAPANGAHLTGKKLIKFQAADNIGVASVQLQLDNNDLGSPLTGKTTSYSWDTAEASSGVHSLTAVAKDAAGNITTSGKISVTIDAQACHDTTAPGVPSGLQSTGSTTSTISLKWNAASDSGCAGLKAYKLYRDGDLVTSTSDLSYTDRNLDSGQNYEYTISSIDKNDNESNKSAALSASTKDQSGTNPPPSSTKPGDANGDGRVNIRDLSVILSHFGGHSRTGDLNSDGVVNIKDLSIVLSRFGK